MIVIRKITRWITLDLTDEDIEEHRMMVIPTHYHGYEVRIGSLTMEMTGDQFHLLLDKMKGVTIPLDSPGIGTVQDDR